MKTPSERVVVKIAPTNGDGDRFDSIVDVLSREFAGTFSRGTVARVVDDAGARWRDAPIKVFVPTLIHRFARDRLQTAASVAGRLKQEVPEVLFVCVQNAGHSQMGAALITHLAGGRLNARSAGSAPTPRSYLQVLKAMDEVKIDLTSEFPKPLTHDMVRSADVVVTMGCGDVCPIYPGVRYVDWDLPNPSGKELEEVRSLRDEIGARAREFLAELLEGWADTQPGTPPIQRPA